MTAELIISRNQLESEIRSFIETELFFGKRTVTPNDSLLTRGVLDSVAHLRLVGFLEKTYGITVAIDDFDPENFDSLDQIVRFTEEKIRNVR